MRIDQVTRQLAEIHGAGMPISSGQRTGGGKDGGSQPNERENGDDNEEEEDAEYEYDDE
jgi:hypothetical protein